jgi:putative ABC transport system permease protein
VSNLSRAYRVNLNVLALVALFTGAFLVYSLQAQAVIARRTQLAFLRVIGLTRKRGRAAAVVEAAMLGVVGARSACWAASPSPRQRCACSAATSAAASSPARRCCSHDPLRRCRLFFLLGVGAAIGGWLPARDAAAARRRWR